MHAASHRNWPVGDSVPAQKSTARGSYRRDRQTAEVEAALLVSSDPITSRRLSQVAGLADPTQARGTLVRALNEFYCRGGVVISH